ncbi:hypothetical protein GOB57_09480 [Sinorhizobium meliloti]|nr:hypothetical protein [Sinorhizobium meliloti]
MVNRAYSDPDGDVEITTPYRGDIRCRKLVVTSTGSVVGNIEAVDVRNFGRVHGVINAANVFINAEDARLRGSVYAPHLGIHPNSTFEAAGSNSRPFEADPLSPVSPSAIETAVQEGIRRELTKRGMASDDQGFAVSADTTFARPSIQSPSAPPAPSAPTSAPLESSAVETTAPAPEREEMEVVDLSWVPPARSRAATVPPSQPRPLPPLFATDK